MPSPERGLMDGDQYDFDPPPSTILREVDAALTAAIRGADMAPRDVQFLIVMNTDARNEFMREMLTRPDMVQRQGGIMDRKYRGAVLAVTHDPEMPRVSVFSRLKS